MREDHMFQIQCKWLEYINLPELNKFFTFLLNNLLIGELFLRFIQQSSFTLLKIIYFLLLTKKFINFIWLKYLAYLIWSDNKSFFILLTKYITVFLIKNHWKNGIYIENNLKMRMINDIFHFLFSQFYINII